MFFTANTIGQLSRTQFNFLFHPKTNKCRFHHLTWSTTERLPLTHHCSTDRSTTISAMCSCKQGRQFWIPFSHRNENRWLVGRRRTPVIGRWKARFRRAKNGAIFLSFYWIELSTSLRWYVRPTDRRLAKSSCVSSAQYSSVVLNQTTEMLQFGLHDDAMTQRTECNFVIDPLFAKEKQSEKARRVEIWISIIRMNRSASRVRFYWADSFPQYKFEHVYHRERSRTSAVCSSFCPLDERWRWISIALQTWRQSQAIVAFLLSRSNTLLRKGR